MPSFKKQLLKKIIIGLGGVIILAVLIFWLRSDINKKVVQIQIQKSELAVKIQIIETISSLNDQFAKAKPYLASLENFLPKKDELISFSKDIQSIAKNSNIDLSFSFGAEKPSTSKEPSSTVFTLVVSGKFNDITNFLKAVYKSRYFVNFVSVDFSKKDNAYTGTFGGLIYLQ